MKNEKYIITSGDEFYFAMNLKRLRVNHKPKLSQEHVAKRLGISRNTYAGYESGRRSPPAWVIISSANYFHVSVDEMIKKFEEKERKDLNENITPDDTKADRK